MWIQWLIEEAGVQRFYKREQDGQNLDRFYCGSLSNVTSYPFRIRQPKQTSEAIKTLEGLRGYDLHSHMLNPKW